MKSDVAQMDARKHANQGMYFAEMMCMVQAKASSVPEVDMSFNIEMLLGNV